MTGILALAMLGCTAEPLSQSWQLDRLRVLSVKADPAEPRPGEIVTLQALTFNPDDTPLSIVWFACLPSAASEFGCTIDQDLLAELEGIDIDALTPEELEELVARAQAAGLIGFEPGLPPTWVPPADILDGLSDEDALEGVSALLSLQALPPEVVDDSDVELAFKRVPVSLATTPNHNPALAIVEVEGTPMLASGRVRVKRGATIRLNPVLAMGSVETYTFTTADGASEERTEQPYFLWYTTAGEFDQPFSLYPTSDVEFTAPLEPHDGEIIVVVRDRRGGMDWLRFHLEVVDEL